jgi:hypothetical protein
MCRLRRHDRHEFVFDSPAANVFFHGLHNDTDILGKEFKINSELAISYELRNISVFIWVIRGNPNPPKAD